MNLPDITMGEIEYRFLRTPLYDLFPPDSDGSPPSFYGYEPLVQSLGCEVALWEEDDSYQGDIRVLLRHGDIYGILIFGYGSCSGCDALQGCSTYEEVDALREEFWRDIRWGSAGNLLGYVRERDWPGEYSWHVDGTRVFLRAVEAILMAETGDIGPSQLPAEDEE